MTGVKKISCGELWNLCNFLWNVTTFNQWTQRAEAHKKTRIWSTNAIKTLKLVTI